MNYINIKSRDDKILKLPVKTLLAMEDFMIKHMIEDTKDTSDLYIDEDYNIIKNILDSLRYNAFIFDKDTNLFLMYYVCDKWCIPQWLIDKILNEIKLSKRLTDITSFIDSLNNNIYKCSNCKVGFNKYDNKKDSCKFHGCTHTIVGTNIYECCNKEEPCKVGYHHINYAYIDTILNKFKEFTTDT
jgi:hypothetical protein